MQKTNKLNPVLINISNRCVDTKSLEYRLHPDTHYEFDTKVFGKAASIRNVMIMLSYQMFDTKLLNKRMDIRELKQFKTGGMRSIPNFWNIITLIVLRRLLDDKELLSTVDTTYEGTDLSRLRVIPVRPSVVGKVTTEIQDTALNTYAVVLGRTLRGIITKFRKEFKNEQFKLLSDMDDKSYSEFTNTASKYFFDKISDNLKDKLLLKGFSETSNMDFYKTFVEQNISR